jgi:shikimate dehydrogenase
VLANRSVDKARALAARHAAPARDADVELRATGLADCGEAFDIVVNASASSLQGAEVPVSPRVLRAGTLALDMMYGPAAAGFIGWAARHGAVGRDGLGMLVEQAGEAFFVWRGVRPDTAPVLAELQARLSAAAA